MPKRGWQAIEVPSGWFEIIRGSRPPSQKWPIASSRQPAQSSRQPQFASGPPVRHGGRWGHRRAVGSVGQRQEFAQPEKVRTSPEAILSTARQRVALGSPQRFMWPRGGCAPEFVEERKASRTGAASGRPGEPVRTVRCQSPEEVGGTRRGEGPSGFRVGGRRKSAGKIARGSHSSQGCACVPPIVPHTEEGAQVVHFQEMVKVLQDERDALVATRQCSCGGFPLPDSLSDLSTLIEVKTES